MYKKITLIVLMLIVIIHLKEISAKNVTQSNFSNLRLSTILPYLPLRIDQNVTKDNAKRSLFLLMPSSQTRKEHKEPKAMIGKTKRCKTLPRESRFLSLLRKEDSIRAEMNARSFDRNIKIPKQHSNTRSFAKDIEYLQQNPVNGKKAETRKGNTFLRALKNNVDAENIILNFKSRRKTKKCNAKNCICYCKENNCSPARSSMENSSEISSSSKQDRPEKMNHQTPADENSPKLYHKNLQELRVPNLKNLFPTRFYQERIRNIPQDSILYGKTSNILPYKVGNEKKFVNIGIPFTSFKNRPYFLVRNNAYNQYQSISHQNLYPSSRIVEESQVESPTSTTSYSTNYVNATTVAQTESDFESIKITTGKDEEHFLKLTTETPNNYVDMSIINSETETNFYSNYSNDVTEESTIIDLSLDETMYKLKDSTERIGGNQENDFSKILAKQAQENNINEYSTIKIPEYILQMSTKEKTMLNNVNYLNNDKIKTTDTYAQSKSSTSGIKTSTVDSKEYLESTNIELENDTDKNSLQGFYYRYAESTKPTYESDVNYDENKLLDTKEDIPMKNLIDQITNKTMESDTNVNSWSTLRKEETTTISYDFKTEHNLEEESRSDLKKSNIINIYPEREISQKATTINQNSKSGYNFKEKITNNFNESRINNISREKEILQDQSDKITTVNYDFKSIHNNFEENGIYDLKKLNADFDPEKEIFQEGFEEDIIIPITFDSNIEYNFEETTDNNLLETDTIYFEDEILREQPVTQYLDHERINSILNDKIKNLNMEKNTKMDNEKMQININYQKSKGLKNDARIIPPNLPDSTEYEKDKNTYTEEKTPSLTTYETENDIRDQILNGIQKIDMQDNEAKELTKPLKTAIYNKAISRNNLNVSAIFVEPNLIQVEELNKKGKSVLSETITISSSIVTKNFDETEKNIINLMPRMKDINANNDSNESPINYSPHQSLKHVKNYRINNENVQVTTASTSFIQETSPNYAEISSDIISENMEEIKNIGDKTGYTLNRKISTTSPDNLISSANVKYQNEKSEIVPSTNEIDPAIILERIEHNISPIKYYSPEILKYMKNHHNVDASVKVTSPFASFMQETPSNYAQMSDNAISQNLASTKNVRDEIDRTLNIDETLTTSVDKVMPSLNVDYEHYKSDSNNLIGNKIYNTNGIMETNKVTISPSKSYFLTDIHPIQLFPSLSASDITELEKSKLYYISDSMTAALPVEVKKLKDNSYALSISNNLCEHILERQCSCCLSPQRHVILSCNQNKDQKDMTYNQEDMYVKNVKKDYYLTELPNTMITATTKEEDTLKMQKSGEEKEEMSPHYHWKRNLNNNDLITIFMPVVDFAKKYNLLLDNKGKILFTNETESHDTMQNYDKSLIKLVGEFEHDHLDSERRDLDDNFETKKNAGSLSENKHVIDKLQKLLNLIRDRKVTNIMSTNFSTPSISQDFYNLDNSMEVESWKKNAKANQFEIIEDLDKLETEKNIQSINTDNERKINFKNQKRNIAFKRINVSKEDTKMKNKEIKLDKYQTLNIEKEDVRAFKKKKETKSQQTMESENQDRIPISRIISGDKVNIKYGEINGDKITDIEEGNVSYKRMKKEHKMCINNKQNNSKIKISEEDSKRPYRYQRNTNGVVNKKVELVKSILYWLKSIFSDK